MNVGGDWDDGCRLGRHRRLLTTHIIYVDVVVEGPEGNLRILDQEREVSSELIVRKTLKNRDLLPL